MAKRSQFENLTDAERLELAARIRAVTEAVGTQVEAAVVAGVSIGQLKAYVLGNSAPSLVPIGKLCLATGHDLNWVVTGKGRPRLDGARPTVGEAVRDAVADGARTKLEVRTARKLGAALEKVYRVGDGELPAEIDDTVEDAARHIVAMTVDEAECVALVRTLAELHAERRKLKR